MNLAESIPENDLMLARLAASKLAKIMHGLMSVGAGAMELESPRDFLANRDQTPLGFLEVLRCIGVKPGHADTIPLLRERVDELSQLTRDWHDLFMKLADWRNMSSQEIRTTVERLGDRYTQFCQQLGDFCTLLGMSEGYLEQAQQDRDYLDAVFQTIAAS